jgi:hypothetical protein
MISTTTTSFKSLLKISGPDLHAQRAHRLVRRSLALVVSGGSGNGRIAGEAMEETGDLTAGGAHEYQSVSLFLYRYSASASASACPSPFVAAQATQNPLSHVVHLHRYSFLASSRACKSFMSSILFDIIPTLHSTHSHQPARVVALCGSGNISPVCSTRLITSSPAFPSSSLSAIR